MRLQRGVFVTGTDTGVGKTLVSCALMVAVRELAYHVVGMKPVATGCRAGPEGLRNSDAVELLEVSSRALPYMVVNPFAYEPAIAPHLAAAEAGRPIQLPQIAAAYEQLLVDADLVVVEGAGGWRVPLDEQYTMADLATRLNLPVIMVVGLRLGCLNHALLTADAIALDQRPLLGWIGNVLDPRDRRVNAMVETLQRRLTAPLLGVIPHLPRPTPEMVAPLINPAPLLASIRKA